MSTETTPKGLSTAEMQLLTQFSNIVAAREINQSTTIQKFVLSYDITNGYLIDLQEVPKEVTPPAVAEA